MCLVILLTVVQICSQFMRGEFIGKALEETYEQEYLDWKKTYEPFANYQQPSTETEAHEAPSNTS